MVINKVYFLTFIVILFLGISKCEKKCNYEDYSYDLCLKDDVCKKTFYIKEDTQYYKKIFKYLLSYHLNKYTHGDNQFKIFLENELCENEKVEYIWMKTLREYHHCKPNEIYEYKIGCICRNGKNCKEMDGIINVFRPKYVSVAVTILCVASLFTLYYNVQKICKIYVKLNNYMNY